MTDAPKRIWACVEPIEEEDRIDAVYIECLGDAPWSKDDPGIEYVRADIADDMLEALEEAKSEMRDWWPDHPAIKQIDAAIAKARGGAE